MDVIYFRAIRELLSYLCNNPMNPIDQLFSPVLLGYECARMVYMGNPIDGTLVTHNFIEEKFWVTKIFFSR